MRYSIWKCNMFDNDILTDKIAEFDNLELAKEYVYMLFEFKQTVCRIKDKHKNIILE